MRRLAGPTRITALTALLAAALLVAGCGIGATNVAAPTEPPPSLAPLSGAIELTRGTLERALKERGIGLIRPAVAFRPPENAALIAVPRGVFQAVLAGDPSGGFITVYELPDPSAAMVAARTQAAWLASGPGAVQAVPGTRQVIRVVGNTILAAALAPDASPDARAVLEVLETIGSGVPVATP